MITKLLHYKGTGHQGEPLVELMTPGEMVKTAQPVHPSVQEFMGDLKPHPRKVYVLVNALGASEFWGQNINGDWFGEEALSHVPEGFDDIPVSNVEARLAAVSSMSPRPYGYGTFYNAHPFKHHCFPAGTLVVMADRTRRPIDEIEEGDEVATHNGKCRVIRTMSRRYDGLGISVRLRGVPDRLVGTPDHPVLSLAREDVHCRHKYNRLSDRGHGAECPEYRTPIPDPQEAPLSKLSPGDYMLLPRPQHGDEEVPQEFAELVGWVASEGHLGKRGSIQFTFSDQNEEDIAAVRTCLGENGLHVTTIPRPQYGTVALTACSRETNELLGRYVRGVKGEKRLTSKILGWSAESLLRMLAAYIDGDGSVSQTGRNRGQLRIRSSSPAMLEILSDVIRSLGVLASVQWDSPARWMDSPTNGERYWSSGSGVVFVPSHASDYISQYSRKKSGFVPSKRSWDRSLGDRYFLIQVLESDQVDLGEAVYNLEVEGDHTYLANEVLVHNCNKDASRSFGRVILAAWNPTMKRVELILELDRDLAAAYEASDILQKIENGEFPDCSMGCKVPYDICRICGHVSKTRMDYCDHARTMMGKILPDGRIVGVDNTLPRFFDISFVLIGADKTAKVMAKLASGGKKYVFMPESFLYMPSATVAEDLGYNSGVEKVAARLRPTEQEMAEAAGAVGHEGVLPVGSNVRRAVVRAAARPLHLPRGTASLADKAIRRVADKLEEKRASHYKLNELTKVVPPGPATGKLLSLLENSDSDLPQEVLERLATHGRGSSGLGSALSTAGSLGIVLKPREFQRVVLTRTGNRPLANRLDADNAVFGPTKDVDDSVPMGISLVAQLIRTLLLPFVQPRSCLGPPMRSRLMVAIRPGSTPPEPTRRKDDLLEKLSAAYNGYRTGLIDMAPDIAPSLEGDLTVMEALYSDSVLDALAGEKRAEDSAAVSAAATLAPMLYLTAGHWEAHKLAGSPITEEIARNHPWLTESLLMRETTKSAAVLSDGLTRALVRGLA